MATSQQAQAPANIRVLVRVRPLSRKELTERGTNGRANVLNLDSSSKGEIDFNGENKENGATISVNNSNDSNRRMTSNDYRTGYTSDGDMNSASGGISKQFMFDAVHGEGSTQGDVYESVKGIVDAVADGYNGTIVAYGQTGSGKTHTVFGSDERENEAESGLVHRSLRDIFHKITLAQAEAETSGDGDQTHDTKTTFKGSFFEIFNERVYDLLALNTLHKALSVREDSNGVYVENLKEVEVKNTSDAQSLLARGLANRHVASTNMNRTSSRSHAVFVLNVKTEHTTPEGLRKVRNSKFTLVDLAGSERQKSTDAIGNRLKEASMINKSLLCLGHVINALVDKEHGKARHVPFRNSKLTFLLKDTWGGNSKTCLVATVSPSGSCLSETISTLTFAQRAKLIKNNAILNEDTCGTVAALQAEVAKLRSKLQESSMTVVEKIVENEVSTNNEELIHSLKRSNERAESRIAELEKQISDETEIVNTLKRKVQEETMVRKFKERRLDYMQRKDSASCDGRDHQVELMKAEIEALQKRLDAPSEEAVGWRVAYEEAREELEKKFDEGDNDYAEIIEKKNLLEETVDRLCGEKFELEGRIAELTESSNETRQEIESIMNEVDALERDMVRCQENLNFKNEQCKEFESRAVAAEQKLENLSASSESVSVEKGLLENQVVELQASIGEYSERVTKLTLALEGKSKELLGMESLVAQKEEELQYAINEIRKDLEESNSALSIRDESIKDLEKRLTGASEENQNLSAQIKEALLEVDRQKVQIDSMEEKVKKFMKERDDAIQSIERETSTNNTELATRVESLQESVSRLSTERDSLDLKLSQMKQNVQTTTESLEEKQSCIEKLQTQLSEMSEAHALFEKSKNDELSDLDRKFFSATERVKVLTMKIAEVEAQRQTIIKNNEEEKELLASNLGNEIDGLQRKLARSFEEKEILQGKLNLTCSKEVELKSCIECLMDTVHTVETNLCCAEKESKHRLDSVISQKEDQEKILQEYSNQLEAERDELLEEIYIIDEELRQIVDENDDLREQIDVYHSQIKAFTHDIEKAKGDKGERISRLEEQLKKATQECNHLKKLKEQDEHELKMKETEISRILDEASKQRLALDDAYRDLTESLKCQEELRMMQRDTELADKTAIQTLTRAKEDLEADIFKCRQGLKEMQNIQDHREQEVQALRKTAKKLDFDAKDALSKLAQSEKHNENIEFMQKSLVTEKDVKIEEIKSKFTSLECDYSALQKQAEFATTSTKELEEKYNHLQDRFTLLKREKGNLEFEFDSLQEDHNALSNQVRVLGDQQNDLKSENIRLLKIIEGMRNGDDISRLDLSVKSEVHSPSGSTWNSDSRLSYETLQTNMDNMLEKMSNPRHHALSACKSAEPEETIPATGDAEGDELDDSFDESMFLPNVEDNVIPQNAPADEDTSDILHENQESTNKSFTILSEENKENSNVKSKVAFFSTPSKRNDYGKRRLPLSDRKNRTPLSTQKKRLRSTSKKLITSSKKSRTNYMLIDNRKLFE